MLINETQINMACVPKLHLLRGIGHGLHAVPRRNLLKSLSKTSQTPDSLDPVTTPTFQQLKSLTKTQLEDRYDRMKYWLKQKRLPTNIDKNGVFANDELDLNRIDVYGFDYDYTLATYKESVEHFIHEETKNILVDELKYPEPIRNFTYNPSSVIRGLHYDIKKGILMKLDSFARIELGTVYRGHERLPDEEVFDLYKKRHLPAYYIESKNSKMAQLADNFSKPQMCLLSDVIQWFRENDVDYQPESLFADVNIALSKAHPRFHAEASTNPSKVLDNSQNEELSQFLTNLRSNNKEVFVVTNSPFKIVDKGMSFMLGENWRDLFDVVIISAKKPDFFAHKNSAVFREYSPSQDRLKWKKVETFKPNKIYAGGTIDELQRLTGWTGDKVLYFGDHVYADLADLSLNHGWRTGAIIHDIEDEVDKMNQDDFKWTLNWSTVLKHNLIETFQDASHSGDPEIASLLKEWSEEYIKCRKDLKEHLNPKFGSVFRCRRNPSYFSKRLFTFSDIYTSKLTNMNRYSLKHTFYPRRGVLPHEFKSWFV